MKQSGGEDPNLAVLPTPELAGQLRIVLCRPAGSRNVGSVCRAVRSMGFSQLHITGRAKEDFVRSEVQTMALQSVCVFDNAIFNPDLEPAVRDCSLIIGFTRRRGSRRKYFSALLEQLAERIRQTPGKIAVLFGNERTGLSDQELQCCHLAAHIATHPNHSSLNLSHAVQIVLYELTRTESRTSAFQAVDEQTLTRLSREITDDMNSMGLRDRLGNQRTEIFLKDIFARAALSPAEADRLRRIFQTMSHYAKSCPHKTRSNHEVKS